MKPLVFKKTAFLLFSLIGILQLTAQVRMIDSVRLTERHLPEITIKAYPDELSLLRSTSAAISIDSSLLRYQAGADMVPVFNANPGVRMEERSPGSYRFSLRGSLLRSPFGVRNIKVYADGIPWTDAGGNTYFNLIHFDDQSTIEILKGPDGSLFGANTGGVINIRNRIAEKTIAPGLQLSAGSFGTFSEQISANKKLGNHLLGIRQSYLRSDGYRRHSAMQRATASLSDHWQYLPAAEVILWINTAWTNYETPGGLTLTQWKTDPRQARPGTGTLPGAEQADAGINMKMMLVGAVNKIKLSKHWQHTLSLFGSGTGVDNPFITNYEERKEWNVGLRTWLSWKKAFDIPARPLLRFDLGTEWQQMSSRINNSENERGQKGALISTAHIISRQHFLFARFQGSFHDRWIIEAAGSLAFASYDFTSNARQKTDFDPQWMPRVAISYQLNKNIVARASLSRGFSPPTIAEVRPSNNLIYTDLQPETGWNRELGFRYFNPYFKLDVSAYDFSMSRSIVRRLDTAGAEYFVNAGGTDQKGLEFLLEWNICRERSGNGLLRSLSVHTSYALQHYSFVDYTIDNNDYSGNKVTGVPSHTLSGGATLELGYGFAFRPLYQFISSMPLNDNNDVTSAPVHLLQCNVAKTFGNASRIRDISFAINNILNEKYSLGYDINAAGGRYYNTAPGRAFFLKISIRI